MLYAFHTVCILCDSKLNLYFVENIVDLWQGGQPGGGGKKEKGAGGVGEEEEEGGDLISFFCK